MISLIRLKENMEFNKNLDEIINALRITTSFKLRQFQVRKKNEERFLEELNGFLTMLSDFRHPYLNSRKGHKLVVVITSDEGFLGELNTLLINTALEEKKEGDEILVLGRKGADYLEDLKEKYTFMPAVSEKIEDKEVENLRNYLMNEYLKKRLSSILIVYSEFISIAFQRVRVEKILPFSVAKKELIKSEEILIESSFESVIEGLISLGLSFIISNIFYSSKLSEFSARLMHLEKSSQELNRINQDLRLQYFKTLHILADERIREIFASKLLWRKKEVTTY